MTGNTTRTASVTIAPIPDDAELQKTLDRVNQFAVQGQYREAREVLHNLRMLYPEHRDTFSEMDDAFFAAERERNRKMSGVSPLPMWFPPSNTLFAFGAILAIFAFTALLQRSVSLPETRRGTPSATYRQANYRKRVPSVPWAIGCTVGSLVCVSGGFALRRFEE